MRLFRLLPADGLARLFSASPNFPSSYLVQVVFVRALLAGVALFLGTTSAWACLWDSDTIRQERSEFPQTWELIVGKFVRHSAAFYQWRVEDRIEKLKETPNQLELRDDLAAAYNKLGQHEKALRLMNSSLGMAPNRYETHANLGTFYVHAGQLRKGLTHIKRALSIKPDAHFGREIYQQYLIEYLLELMAEQGDGQVTQLSELKLPLEGNFAEYLHLRLGAPVDSSSAPSSQKSDQASGQSGSGHSGSGHSKPLKDGPGVGPEQGLTDQERENAIRGIQGMMRFGQHDSPILLEALADLLLFPQLDEQSHQLAARAYLQASYQVEGQAGDAYRELASEALALQQGVSLQTLERDFQQELQEGQDWFAELTANEKRWIAEEADPEAKFAAVYWQEPELALASSTGFFGLSQKWTVMILGGVVVVVFGVVVFGVVVLLRLRMTKKLATQSASSPPPSSESNSGQSGSSPES